MKSVKELNDMLSRGDHFGVLFGILEHIDVLNSRTEIKPHRAPKCLAVQDGVDFASAARCTFDMGHKLPHSWGTATGDVLAAHQAQEQAAARRRSYDNSKVGTRRYRLVPGVHPETVVRWFLDIHHYWFDGTLGPNLFDGMRDDAFTYLCGWIETGELPEDHTTLEIHVAGKFQEWLDACWQLAPAPPIWGTGLEEMLEVQKRPEFAVSAPLVDYTKPHAFDLDGESGLKHTEYRVCKCGLSEGNVLHI